MLRAQSITQHATQKQNARQHDTTQNIQNICKTRYKTQQHLQTTECLYEILQNDMRN